MRELPVVVGFAAVFGTCSAPGPLENPLSPASARSDPPREIEVRPWGPTEEMVAAARARLETIPTVRAVLGGVEHRLLSFELTDGDDSRRVQDSLGGYRATFFDYSRNRAYVVSGRFADSAVEVTRTLVQPEPDEDELNSAIALLARDPKVGPRLRDGTLTPYEPMPPLANADLPVGQVDRIVNVGLMARGTPYLSQGGAPSDIVGVNMTRPGAPLREQAAVRAAPPADPLADSRDVCGPENARQSSTRRGTAGSFNVVVRRGEVELWSFLVFRPSASSGRRGSGIELRDLRYRGKLVFARAHVPILNVQYQANRCGPFRDWQWQEGAFVADGADLAPGIRRTVTRPLTSVDTNMDRGNFRGVALFDSGTEVQLVTEMNAGWYRYVMKWFLRDDGVIQPQFGFGAVENRCVCNLHFHHAYWRFDFDIVGSASNSACVAADPEGSCADITTETRLATIPSGLLVRNTLGTEAYRLLPGASDGAPDTFSRATAWVLSAKGDELDDGVNCTSGRGCRTEIDIDRFANRENVSSANVVVWYRASFRHQDEGAEGGEELPHVVGPELRPVGW